MSAAIVGALILAIPALAVAWAVLWRRHTPVFYFAAAMILVGVGYLTSTGASEDIARRILPNLIGAPARPAAA